MNVEVAGADSATVALKYNNVLFISDSHGDLVSWKRETGLFWYGTRFLRTCNLFLDHLPLLLLSYAVAEDGTSCQFDLCNPHIPLSDGTVLRRGTIYINRNVEVEHNQVLQTIRVTSFHDRPVSVALQIDLQADFRDILEVRRRGNSEDAAVLPSHIEPAETVFLYAGSDGVERKTQCLFSPAADMVGEEGVSWQLDLTHGQTVEIQIRIAMAASGSQLLADGSSEAPSAYLPVPEIVTHDLFFNRLFRRGIYDLMMLSTSLLQGTVPYAGIPWYACPFGRDALITSLEFLPWFPEVARGTLAFLAFYQGTKVDPRTDEEPGRILHELRGGELAQAGKVPFIPYYGSIDATPLFLIVLEAYIRWTNDRQFLEELWPHVKAAVDWMMHFGDKDGDGFLEYRRFGEDALVNQGWKDSTDCVSHADGSLASFPIALCEVQAIAYAAYCAAGYLASSLGQVQQAIQWMATAQELQKNFLTRFWWEQEQAFYLALDGEKQACAVLTSNAGQCLWSGIVPQEQAQVLVNRLLQEDMYSGWGIRTLSTTARRYSPISYHNGSVWPHDMALIGAGFARYGRKFEAARLLENLRDASTYYEQARLPELLCGFDRRQEVGPASYPTACSPQAWTAGAPFLLLSALLGLQPDAEHHQLLLKDPVLPAGIDEMKLRGLRVGQQRFDLHISREHDRLTTQASGSSGIHIIQQ